jgi:hypothetical protein
MQVGIYRPDRSAALWQRSLRPLGLMAARTSLVAQTMSRAFDVLNYEVSQGEALPTRG